MMDFIYEIPAEKQLHFLDTFFGAGATKESVSKLSDKEFFASFLGAAMAQAEAVGGINFGAMEVLGEVKEGNDIAHVVTRTKVSVGEVEVEAMEVVSFKKSGDSWKALMSGKMKGMANQLRAALTQQQNRQPPPP
ncbi:MAG: hypothetical protein FD130_457 [Halothiobacillaceae bacterium]|nr:MAG: hypothetical protein FD130_457 [Halothiobacillaceae bacterium]